ncbi:MULTISPECIES: ArdC-like ssDNA-binding domain-containing protein [Nisaea]|jgi:antirestriction protein ArdC|uniref:ArdC-like ssDNA-binding domain-containing protein n=1 Tax=Nisaea TaxID=390876 RepID=UPI000A0572DE|nr:MULTISPECIES: ArdC-like ssDNA-binding domain-containing protein [Nisaea]|tara:strand:+ start:82 stop:396 length:315 start_codon:yes stop_codon:yes gene_type:complete
MRKTMIKTDRMQAVTDKIISALETGVRPWKKSWDAGAFPEKPLRSNGEAYKGVKIIIVFGVRLNLSILFLIDWQCAKRQKYYSKSLLTWVNSGLVPPRATIPAS